MPEHLLWALATQKGCIGAEIMSKSKIKSDRLRTLIEKSSTGVKPSPDQDTLTVPVLSDDAKRVIEKAVLTANIYEHRYVGTEHLLSGLLQVKNRPIKDFFAKEKIDTKQLNEQIAVVLKSTSKFPEFTDTIDELEEELPLGVTIKDTPEPSVLKETSNKTPALDYFARDLTSEEVQQNIDPVIARDDEIQRVMEILCRRTKNNPVLLGEPGVGKTAIAEGLAKRILEDDVPPILQGKRIMALDMSLVIAGTMYRGEFEERLRQVIEEVRGNANIILFIDELHTIMGTGASAGSLDAANILKPSLARGDIRCIGATTTAEFKKNIESDAALERRFQPVIIKEPSAEDTQAILQGICKNYERFHNVEISEAAIQAAVDLSIRYIPDKYLPDKAIDLIDEAAAAHRVADTSSEITSRLLELEREIKRVQQDKRQAIVEERFKDAIKIKEVEEKKAKLLTKLHQEERAQGLIGTVEEADVARVVSRMTGVPLDDLSQGASKKLLGLEKTLSKHVLGQETTIQTVADAMRRAKAGINHPERPLASFLFIGPSGVGKTELAHTIAKELFGGSDDLIRLDMSEYAEGFTVSKLIGAN